MKMKFSADKIITFLFRRIQRLQICKILTEVIGTLRKHGFALVCCIHVVPRPLCRTICTRPFAELYVLSTQSQFVQNFGFRDVCPDLWRFIRVSCYKIASPEGFACVYGSYPKILANVPAAIGFLQHQIFATSKLRYSWVISWSYWAIMYKIKTLFKSTAFEVNFCETMLNTISDL